MTQVTTTVATIPSADHATGTATTGARTVPATFDSATVTINCTTGVQGSPFTGFAHPFSDPTMAITFGVHWSWDGGATFPESTEGTQNGSASGTWGTDRHGNPIMAPSVVLGIPFNASLGGKPTTYRAYMTVVNGPITFGLTLQETTG